MAAPIALDYFEFEMRDREVATLDRACNVQLDGPMTLLEVPMPPPPPLLLESEQGRGARDILCVQ